MIWLFDFCWLIASKNQQEMAGTNSPKWLVAIHQGTLTGHAGHAWLPKNTIHQSACQSYQSFTVIFGADKTISFNNFIEIYSTSKHMISIFTNHIFYKDFTCMSKMDYT